MLTPCTHRAAFHSWGGPLACPHSLIGEQAPMVTNAKPLANSFSSELRQAVPKRCSKFSGSRNQCHTTMQDRFPLDFFRSFFGCVLGISILSLVCLAHTSCFDPPQSWQRKTTAKTILHILLVGDPLLVFAGGPRRTCCGFWAGVHQSRAQMLM